MTAPAGAALPRIRAFTAACMLVSNAVRSGTFTTTRFLARDLGDPTWILTLWLCGGALALAGALSYAELGAAMPRVGGEYVYLREAFGPGLAFLSGWTSFTVGFGAAIAASCIGFAGYLATLLPEASARMPRQAPAIALAWALTGIHLLDVEGGGYTKRYRVLVEDRARFLHLPGDFALRGAPQE